MALNEIEKKCEAINLILTEEHMSLASQNLLIFANNIGLILFAITSDWREQVFFAGNTKRTGIFSGLFSCFTGGERRPSKKCQFMMHYAK